MPSLRQKVTTYFRQLSFIADGPARSPRKTEDDNNFITKYLEGRMDRIFVPGPEIYNGQNPTDLPELKIGTYTTGPQTITAACTGPDDGLTGIKRSKLHLSASFADDIDFIDTIPETDCFEVRKSITTNNRNQHTKFNRLSSSGGVGARKLSNGSITSSSDQNANKTAAGCGGMRSRKNSRTGLANLSSNTTKDKTTTTAATAVKTTTQSSKAVQDEEANANKSTTIVVSMVSTKAVTGTNTTTTTTTAADNDQNNKNLANATMKTEDTTPSDKHTKDTSNSIITSTSTNGHHDTATSKLLEHTTERLLREAVSNQAAAELMADSVAGVTNWKMESDCAYGISVSLYENNMLTKEPMGNPIADCYGMVVRGDAAAMALADGVNWGDGARLAARSAVHGCLDYLDRAIFGLSHECMATTTHEVFVSLLRSLWEGHSCILEVGGALSTLTIAVVLPLRQQKAATAEDEEQLENVQRTNSSSGGGQKYVVCACNVGDSLGYVYSKKHGVREFTQASHDITSMRDMRDALGALGPADGNKPELSNLTLSMTIIERGDIVFLTSDGVSDNFDPVVGKFADAWTSDVKLQTSSSMRTSAGAGILAPKRQNKSASAIYARLHRGGGDSEAATPVHPPHPASGTPPVRPPRTKKSCSPESGATSAVPSSAAPSRPKYMRAHTVIEPRRLSSAGNPSIGARHMLHSPAPQKILRSAAGLPLVTGPQRHALTLHRLEDLLSYGINGTFSPCASARRLCHLLIDFVRMITSARRKTLEQRELFYKLATGLDGIRREVELNRMQHRAARKRIVDSSAFGALPGKLDHATVVAYTVGGSAREGKNTSNVGVRISQQAQVNAAAPSGKVVAPLQSQEFNETNF